MTGRDIITGMFDPNTANAPVAGQYGAFVYFSSGFSEGNFGFQIAVTIGTSSEVIGKIVKIHFRGRWSSWGQWIQIYSAT